MKTRLVEVVPNPQSSVLVWIHVQHVNRGINYLHNAPRALRYNASGQLTRSRYLKTSTATQTLRQRNINPSYIYICTALPGRPYTPTSNIPQIPAPIVLVSSAFIQIDIFLHNNDHSWSPWWNVDTQPSWHAIDQWGMRRQMTFDPWMTRHVTKTRRHKYNPINA